VLESAHADGKQERKKTATEHRIPRFLIKYGNLDFKKMRAVFMLRILLFKFLHSITAFAFQVEVCG
jgi:hypothetical protein